MLPVVELCIARAGTRMPLGRARVPGMQRSLCRGLAWLFSSNTANVKLCVLSGLWGARWPLGRPGSGGWSGAAACAWDRDGSGHRCPSEPLAMCWDAGAGSAPGARGISLATAEVLERPAAGG